VPFIGTVGLRLDTITPGHAVATLPSRPEVHNHMGTCHAGAVYTLGESASGGVVLSVFADLLPNAFIALKQATVTHTRAAPGDVVATATLQGDPAQTRATYDQTGKVDFDVEVAFAVGETDVARMVYTWAVRAPR
jgi:acyl-coenzyme A thioesterase PaaI-like protein